MREHPANLHSIVYFLCSLITVACLFSCGGESGSETSVTSGSASSCGAVANPIEAKLGQGANFILRPQGAKGPLMWRRIGHKYIGDKSGGMTFAADTFPLSLSVFRGVATETNVQSFQVTYKIGDTVANSERRYLETNPGTAVEIVELTDTNGRTFRCELTTKLRP